MACVTKSVPISLINQISFFLSGKMSFDMFLIRQEGESGVHWKLSSSRLTEPGGKISI